MCRGSPPLTRGILIYVRDGIVFTRFTPAHAGNTKMAPCIRNSSRVHPRSRGEYAINNLEDVRFQGSPPLTRGILSQREKDLFNSRFTPAHAGNTACYRRACMSEEVHPRSRGEYSKSHIRWHQCQGSPPLTRGILITSRSAGSESRFTPAHAGNTFPNFQRQ